MFEQGYGLFCVPAEGGRISRLTPEDRKVRSAACSPDGEKIAFLSPGLGENKPWQLFTMNADGSAVAQLTDLTDRVTGLQWHPGGKHLCFTVHADLPDTPERNCWKYRESIHIVQSDGTGLRRLEFGDSVNHLGGFSPSGRYLSYMTSGRAQWSECWRNWDIRVLDLRGGGEPLVVTDNDIYDTSPLFSPDGATLLFVSDRIPRTAPVTERPLGGWSDLYTVEQQVSEAREKHQVGAECR